MPADRWLADTNVLIRWVQRGDPQFPIVRRAVRSLVSIGASPCYTSQNFGELWNVLTRPANRNGYGLSPQLANGRAITIESEFELLPDSLLTHAEWRRMIVDHAVSGVQVHDARLVAAMRVHGVQRILTFNVADFARYPGIEAIHPSQVT